MLNDIIYNECSNVVSLFKDYLIFDDVSEFLKRPYECSESVDRLPRIIEFYEKYSKVFPNYVNLPENKFMFKNIERKQKYWDSRQNHQMQIEEYKQREDEFMHDSSEGMLFSQNFIKMVKEMSVLDSYENNESTIGHLVDIEQTSSDLN